MNEDQLEMITKIAVESNSRIEVADFPLLPNHHADELLAFSQEAFEIATDSDLPTFVVADSAGAKLALQLLVNNPGKVAGTSLISPWLDMKLTDPEIEKRSQEDVLLDLPTLQKIGGWFESGTSPETWVDFSDSSQLQDLGDIQIFFGANEMLVPSNRRFVQALTDAANTNPLVTEFKDVWHDYTLWFKLLETKRPLSKLLNLLKIDMVLELRKGVGIGPFHHRSLEG